MGQCRFLPLVFASVLSLALAPVVFDEVFAGVIVPPEVCGNGMDDDLDGLIDILDPDCFIILFPAPGALPPLPGFPDPDPSTDPLLGDFKCYRTQQGFGPDVRLRLVDQFQDKEFEITLIEQVCNPVFKEADPDDPGNPDDGRYPSSPEPEIFPQHYKVYNFTKLPSDVAPYFDDVLLRDQWGVTRHFELIPIQLWVPQEKIETCPPPGKLNGATGFCETPEISPGMCPNPAFYSSFPAPGSGICTATPSGTVFPKVSDIHWKCYEVPDIFPVETEFVTLTDLNLNSPSMNEIIKLHKICTPVKKFLDNCDGIGGNMCGDDKILDHLKCYRIDDDVDFIPGFDVQYTGQFGTTIVDLDDEWEVCLAANKLHFPTSAIGGTVMPIDATSMLLVGAQMTALWLIPVVVAGVGIGFVLLRKFKN